MSQGRDRKRKNPEQLPGRNKILKSAIVPGPVGSSASMHDVSTILTSTVSNSASGSVNTGVKTPPTGEAIIIFVQFVMLQQFQHR